MKLQESLIIISYLYGRVKSIDGLYDFVQKDMRVMGLDEVIPKHNHNASVRKLLAANLSELTIVINEALLEEYQKFFTINNIKEEADRVLQFQKDVKPAFKHFNRWTDRKAFRNILVAHNLRNRDGSSILNLESDEPTPLNFPHYNDDYRIIFELHTFIYDCLVKHFRHEILALKEKAIINNHIEYSGKNYSLTEEIKTINEWRKNAGLSQQSD